MAVDREQRTRALRYKRPALSSMGYEYIQREREDIVEACSDVAWFAGDRNALTAALDGSDEEANEFILACGDLSGQAGLLLEQLYEVGEYDTEGTARMYDDCTVALIGNRYDTVGFDTLQEDYFSLTGYDTELAESEAGTAFRYEDYGKTWLAYHRKPEVDHEYSVPPRLHHFQLRPPTRQLLLRRLRLQENLPTWR